MHRRGAWPEEAAIDTVTLPYLDRHRRRIRLAANSGEAYFLDLPRAHHLVDGDGLELDGGGYFRVRAAPEPVFEIKAANRQICCGLPGISAIGTCRCKSPASDCGSGRITSSPRW